MGTGSADEERHELVPLDRSATNWSVSNVAFCPSSRQADEKAPSPRTALRFLLNKDPVPKSCGSHCGGRGGHHADGPGSELRRAEGIARGPGGGSSTALPILPMTISDGA